MAGRVLGVGVTELGLLTCRRAVAFSIHGPLSLQKGGDGLRYRDRVGEDEGCCDSAERTESWW